MSKMAEPSHIYILEYKIDNGEPKILVYYSLYSIYRESNSLMLQVTIKKYIDFLVFENELAEKGVSLLWESLDTKSYAKVFQHPIQDSSKVSPWLPVS